MPRYFKMIITGVLFFAAAVPAGSELYQYTDQNGITRLTDNIYSVPVKYRSQLEAYSEIESLSGKMEIQPLEKKIPRQTATEKTIVPKKDKPLPATAEKKDISPAAPPIAAPETPLVKKPRTAPALVTKPAQAPAPDTQAQISQTPEGKAVAEPEGKPDVEPVAEIASHKSQKIVINRKTDKIIDKKSALPDTDPEKPTAKALPEKTDSKPKVSSKPVKEPRTVKKEPPEISISKLTPDKTADNHRADNSKKDEVIPPKTADTVKKSASVVKSGKIKTDKYIQKKDTPTKVAPEKVTPVIEEKTIAETKKSGPENPEPKAEIKTAQNTGHTTLAQKEIKLKNIISEIKTDALQKTSKPVEEIKNRIKTDTQKAPAPEIKKTTESVPAPTAVPEQTPLSEKSDTLNAADRTKPQIEIPVTDTRQISLNSPEPAEETGKKIDYTAEPESGAQTREMESRGREVITEEDENLELARLQTTRISLAEKKEALNKTFLRLMEEKKTLEDNVNEDDEKSVLEYNKKVKRLNIKIKQYKNEKKRLQAKIEEYNETIRQSTAN